MDPTSLTDIIAAQHAYAAARSQALQAALAKDADPTAALSAQRQAMLQYLQTRVSLLTTARDKAMQQANAEIAKYQKRISEVQQLLQEPAATPAPTTAPKTTPATTPTIATTLTAATLGKPGDPGNTTAPVAAQAEKGASQADPKKGA